MQIAIIGCGNMGGSIALRLSEHHQLLLYDRHTEKTQSLEEKCQGQACQQVQEALRPAQMVLLAVKPQNLKEIAEAIKESLREDQLLVSLLTGVSLRRLRQHFPKGRLVRMMPNLPLIHGEGVIGLAGAVKEEEKAMITKTFELLGKIHWLPEEKINPLTALTGSGPAFLCALVEAMIDAGIAMGFSSTESRVLVYQMLSGTLALLENSHNHPGELKWQIASPQGTTIAGLKRLEELALRGGIMNTFLAAYERANSLIPQGAEKD
jgi:pyrroline-5-carboxylate reductase